MSFICTLVVVLGIESNEKETKEIDVRTQNGICG
jgi:hypothetical protein